jgi:hypothetical protein
MWVNRESLDRMLYSLDSELLSLLMDAFGTYAPSMGEFQAVRITSIGRGN